MNRRLFLGSIGGLGAIVANAVLGSERWKILSGLFGATSVPDATRAAPPDEAYDRLVSGRVPGFVVPAGEIWKVDGEVESESNVVVEGTLVMRPGDTLRFVDIDEREFVGGGMKPLETDVGLWVVGSGVLDIEGTPVEPWNRSGSDPTWEPGHEIVLMPWERGDSGWDPRKEASTIRPYRLGDPVPEIVPGLPTEVVNLSRDVRIEGSPDGRTHIWIGSDQPQKIRYVSIRHVGPQGTGDRRRMEGGGDPRQRPGGPPEPRRGGGMEGVPGRYGLHFHLMENASRGTLVEGVVVRDCGNHAYVPHASHGITFRRCVAFDTFTEQFWWDEKDTLGSTRTDFTKTDDVVYEECIGALVRWPGPGYHGANFFLGRTRGGAVLGCVAVGSQGWKEGSGFHWPSQANPEPNVWRWRDNLSHNHLKGGFRVWQNTPTIHDVPGLKALNCGEFGIANGAYTTPGYHWSDFEIIGLGGSSYGSGLGFTAGIVLHAVAPKSPAQRGGDDRAGVDPPRGRSRRRRRAGAGDGAGARFPDRRDGYALSFERGLIRGAQVGVFSTNHVARAEIPTLVKDVAFEEIGDVVVLVDEGRGKFGGLLDFVDCTRDGSPLRPGDVRIASTSTGFRARFQSGSEAWMIDERGSAAPIAPFYRRPLGP